MFFKKCILLLLLLCLILLANYEASGFNVNSLGLNHKIQTALDSIPTKNLTSLFNSANDDKYDWPNFEFKLIISES